MTFEEWWALYRRDSAMAQVGLARLDDPHTEIIAYRAWLAGVDSQRTEIEAGNSEIRAYQAEKNAAIVRYEAVVGAAREVIEGWAEEAYREMPELDRLRAALTALEGNRE